MTPKHSINKAQVIAFITISVLFSSCVSRKDITYFQKLDRNKIDTINVDRSINEDASKLRTSSFQPIIQPGDLLNISLSSISPEATSMFTFQASGRIGSTDPIANAQPIGFLVDYEGNIQFPVLGNFLAKGKTTLELRNELTQKLAIYLESPVVSVRFSNFKVSILGDVTKQGVYSFLSERVSILEALASAGDLTIFGNRKSVKIIRERNGKNEITTVDLTDKDLLKNPIMFLHPNDVIYVEPGKGKIASADNTYRILPMILTGLNIAALLFYRFAK